MTLLNSCETQEIVLTEQNNSNPIYNSVISSYLTNFKTSVSKNKENTKKISALMQAIDYNTIKQYDLKNTIKLVVIDLKNFSVSSEVDQTKAIFFVLNNSIIRSNIVTIKNKLPFENPDQVIVSIFDKKENKDNYSGKIEFYNLFQNILLSDEFENGVLTKNSIALPNLKNAMANRSTCDDWYELTTYSDGSQTAEYLYTICDPCSGGGGELFKNSDCDSGSGGGGSGYSSNGQPDYPPNPKPGQFFYYVDEDGNLITKRYNEITGNWDFYKITIQGVTVTNNKNNRYDHLKLLSQYVRKPIIFEEIIYKFDLASGSFEGVALEALDDVILDPSFKNNPCLMDIYSKLGGSITFQNFLNKFDNNMSILDLKISVDNEFKKNQDASHWKSQAITLIPINNSIEIIFNNDMNLAGRITNFPQLSIATNLIHEVIHAEINRELATASTNNNINPQQMTDSEWKSYLKNIKDDFAEMFKYYSKYVLNTNKPSDFQHQYMADKYRGVIIEALKQYDNNSHSEDYYDALAWNGLKNTIAWNKLTPNQKTKILETIQTIYKNEKYCN